MATWDEIVAVTEAFPVVTGDLWKAINKALALVNTIDIKLNERMDLFTASAWDHILKMRARLTKLEYDVVDIPSKVEQKIIPLVLAEVDNRDQAIQDLIDQHELTLLLEQARLRGWTEEQIALLKAAYVRGEELVPMIEAILGMPLSQVSGNLERLLEESEEHEHWWDTLARFFGDPWGFLVEEFIKWLTGNLERIFDTIETALWEEA